MPEAGRGLGATDQDLKKKPGPAVSGGPGVKR